MSKEGPTKSPQQEAEEKKALDLGETHYSTPWVEREALFEEFGTVDTSIEPGSVCLWLDNVNRIVDDEIGRLVVEGTGGLPWGRINYCTGLIEKIKAHVSYKLYTMIRRPFCPKCGQEVKPTASARDGREMAEGWHLDPRYICCMTKFRERYTPEDHAWWLKESKRLYEEEQQALSEGS